VARTELHVGVDHGVPRKLEHRARRLLMTDVINPPVIGGGAT